MDPETRITISRNSPRDVKQRQVIVKLDGQWIGDLLFGQKITRVVEPGPHTLRVDNTWQKKTVEFRIEPGEEARFQAVNTVGRFTWLLVAALGAGPMYVSLEPEPEQ